MSWRHKVYAAAFGAGSVEGLLQFCHGGAVRDAALRGHVGHTVHRAVPYDVLDVDIVAVQRLAVAVDVYHRGKAVAVGSYII